MRLVLLSVISVLLLSACSSASEEQAEAESADEPSSSSPDHTSPGDSSPTSTPASTPTSTLDPTIDGGQFDVTPLENWWTDVIAGDRDALLANCWTIAPERVDASYLDPDPAVFDAIFAESEPQGAEGGIYWLDDNLQISLAWAELESSYACPQISGEAIEDTSAEQAAYNVERIIARAEGEPIHDDDTNDNYPLSCDYFSSHGEELIAAYPRFVGATVTTTYATVDEVDGWRVETAYADGSEGPSVFITSVDSSDCVGAID